MTVSASRSWRQLGAARPLVLSDIAVFRELTEGRGLYADPADSHALAKTIGEVLANPKRQAALVAYGDARVRAFGFGRLAGEVERLYETVLAAS